MSDLYIACPKCDWHPDANSIWDCSCGYQWNTFETHGICPMCGKVWMMTQCLSEDFGGCGMWSDHEDWYHDEDAPSVEEYLV